MKQRRDFLKLAALGGSALALPGAAVAAPSAPPGPVAASLPAGKLCVLVYGKSRTRLPDGNLSSIVVVDLPTSEVRRISSPVANLHGLYAAGPQQSQLWGIGHGTPEKLDVFDRGLNRLETRTYPGVRFRGHGIAWKAGLLVAAESKSDPAAGGFLMHLDEDGKLLQQYPTGGLRPHEVVACGEHLAIAHYGYLESSSGMPAFGAAAGFPGQVGQPPGSGLLFETVAPGVSFLRRDTLELVAFHKMPGRAAISHLGVTADQQVMAMGLNTQWVRTETELYALAEEDGATLLPSEWYERGYEIYSPLFRVDAVKGIVQTLSESAARMRRGQSFSSDPSTGLVVATFAGSQTLYVQQPGRPDRFLSTLDFGLPNPRGCAVIPGTNLVAVSGHDDNLALIDVAAERLERLVGLPMGGHSHQFWIPG